MLAFLLTSTSPFHHLLRVFLLMAASLSAHNQSWDSANCTEGVVSVFRGSCAVMMCNMTNKFSEITIKLMALGEETRTIFYKKPPGNFSKDGWQLRNLGGQALLMINEAQAIHAGNYSWKLYGHQPIFRKTFLNVSEPQDQEEATSQRHSVVSNSQDSPAVAQKMRSFQVNVGPLSPGTVGAITVIVIILILALIFAWYKCHHGQKLQQIRAFPPGLSHGWEPPCNAYLTLH